MEDLHFMVDKKILERIITESGITAGETILEIGGGHGELTSHLAGKGRLIVIEKNKEFFSYRKEGSSCGRMLSVIMLA